jgi:hypothetical protein
VRIAGPSAILLCCATALAAAEDFDSPLATYMWRRSEPFAPEIEAVLSRIEANSRKTGGLAATVRWTCESEQKLDTGRDSNGPLSLKSCPNWHTPRQSGFWPQGTYTIVAVEGAFRIEKPADPTSPDDWWQKDGEHLYSRVGTVNSPMVQRLHTDALEADLIGYAEGLCLLLWAFDPGEYLRRAELLEISESPEGAPELKAKPFWVARPFHLQNRKHYPFDQSTLESWADLRPVVTYKVDPQRGAISAAEFVYHKPVRKSTGDWTAETKPSGLVVACVVEEFGRTPGGTWYPTRTSAEVRKDETLIRRTALEIRLDDRPATLAPVELPVEKRHLDSWPHYRPEVFEAFIGREGRTHANLVGLARALCFDGRLADGEQTLLEAVSALERDRRLSPETFGGIDWELGFAVYELLWRFSEEEVTAFWNRVPRTSTWAAILSRAVDLYRQFRPKESAKIAVLLDNFGQTFEKARRERAEKTMWENYLWCLGVDAAYSKQAGDESQTAYLEKLRQAVADRNAGREPGPAALPPGPAIPSAAAEAAAASAAETSQDLGSCCSPVRLLDGVPRVVIQGPLAPKPGFGWSFHLDYLNRVTPEDYPAETKEDAGYNWKVNTPCLLHRPTGELWLQQGNAARAFRHAPGETSWKDAAGRGMTITPVTEDDVPYHRLDAAVGYKVFFHAEGRLAGKIHMAVTADGHSWHFYYYDSGQGRCAGKLMSVYVPGPAWFWQFHYHERSGFLDEIRVCRGSRIESSLRFLYYETPEEGAGQEGDLRLLRLTEERPTGRTQSWTLFRYYTSRSEKGRSHDLRYVIGTAGCAEIVKARGEYALDGLEDEDIDPQGDGSGDALFDARFEYHNLPGDAHLDGRVRSYLLRNAVPELRIPEGFSLGTYTFEWEVYDRPGESTPRPYEDAALRAFRTAPDGSVTVFDVNRGGLVTATRKQEAGSKP